MFVPGRRLALLAVLVGLISTAGCSGAAKPKTLAPISVSPSPPPTPTATDLAQVEAVVRHYYALLNAPTSLANARVLADLMTRNCKCRQVAASTAAVARRHQRYFGTTTLTSVVPSLDGSNDADVLVDYDYERSGIIDSSGHVVTSYPARHGAKADFRLVKLDHTWLISALVYVSAGRP